ncbi:hypothetical protein LZ32DRAFT_413707 [Colletotrichum eremochloae]|nr:hypothetical protein LZ32DRAFT_413707 [Colletotrichum eremochloae]
MVCQHAAYSLEKHKWLTCMSAETVLRLLRLWSHLPVRDATFNDTRGFCWWRIHKKIASCGVLWRLSFQIGGRMAHGATVIVFGFIALHNECPTIGHPHSPSRRSPSRGWHGFVHFVNVLLCLTEIGIVCQS